MDTYTFTLVLGGAGLVAMAAAGAAHLGPVRHGVQHGLPHGGPQGMLRGGHQHGASQATHHVLSHGPQYAKLLALMSPRVLFGVLLGFGATGILLRPLVPGALLPVVAVLGALGLEFAVMAPLWRFMLRFASRPARTLEDSITSLAHAANAFNAAGEGIVAIEVDGHIVQCLGVLRPEDRGLGVRVRAGDVLRVEEVDAERQRCTVSYVGHTSPE